MKFDYESGYVYFMTDGERVKIGFSKSPIDRMAAIQVNTHRPLSLLGTIAAPKYQEKLIQSRFAEHRIRGEWFTLNEDILEFIEDLSDDGILVSQREHTINRKLAKISERFENFDD